MPCILHLTLKREFFVMIASGEKKEEYRDIKPYWAKRLFINGDDGQPKQYDIVRFRHGYSKDAPVVDVEWKGCWKGHDKLEWGAHVGREYYAIWLGKILSIKNYKQS